MLVLITIAGDTAGDNFAPVGDKTLQPLEILIINVIRFFHTKPANLTSGKASRFFIVPVPISVSVSVSVSFSFPSQFIYLTLS